MSLIPSLFHTHFLSVFESGLQAVMSQMPSLFLTHFLSVFESGLQAVMSRMSFVFDEVVHRSVYAEMQDFVQIELREPLRKAAKNKKELLKSIIVAIR